MALLDRPSVDHVPVLYTDATGAAETSASVGNYLYRSAVKRLVDVILALMTMPVWLPAVLIGALFVARDGGRPFYIQPRVGRNGRVFQMIKLRSMVVNSDAVLQEHLRKHPVARAEWNATQKLKDDPRITPVGRFIRKTSLDELPQLFNVLLGHMSLVGPRPMMVCQMSLYPGWHYYEMRPGLTGFWQVSSRNNCRFVGRARYDAAYFRTMSLKTDMFVMLRTVRVVLRGTGC